MPVYVPSPRLAIAIAIAAGCLALPGPPAAAQIDIRLDGRPVRLPQQQEAMLNSEELAAIDIDPALLSVVQQLDDPSFAAREAAMARLLELAPDKFHLYAILERDSLTAEQRYRLVAAVRDHLLNLPRGAIGIQMDPFFIAANGPLRIRVRDLIPGLPAERVLQIGDEITHVDGQPIMASDDLQFRVQAKKPGDHVRVTVERRRLDDNGEVIRNEAGDPVTETLEFDLQLGSIEMLDEDPRQRPSRVETSRRIEADGIAIAYSPRPEPIAVKGGVEHLAAAAGPGLDPRSHINLIDVGSDPVIDQHPDIQNLLLQRRLIAEGRMVETKLLRDIWSQQLRLLQEQTRMPGLTREERAYLGRVIDRFAELISP
jgi:hypothetical protein